MLPLFIYFFTALVYVCIQGPVYRSKHQFVHFLVFSFFLLIRLLLDSLLQRERVSALHLISFHSAALGSEGIKRSLFCCAVTLKHTWPCWRWRWRCFLKTVTEIPFSLVNWFQNHSVGGVRVRHIKISFSSRTCRAWCNVILSCSRLEEFSHKCRVSQGVFPYAGFSSSLIAPWCFSLLGVVRCTSENAAITQGCGSKPPVRMRWSPFTSNDLDWSELCIDPAAGSEAIRLSVKDHRRHSLFPVHMSN